MAWVLVRAAQGGKSVGWRGDELNWKRKIHTISRLCELVTSFESG